MKESLFLTRVFRGAIFVSIVISGILCSPETVESDTIPGLPYTDKDGNAELTHLPATSVDTIEAGSPNQVTVSLKVDSDTGYVKVMLAIHGTGANSYSYAGNAIEITPGSMQDVDVKFWIPYVADPDIYYYISVDTAESLSVYNTGTYMKYREDGVVYTKVPMVNGSVYTKGIESDPLGNLVTKLDITSPSSVSAASTQCQNSGNPVAYTVTSFPTIFTGNAGSCFYILTMPAANTNYSISLDYENNVWLYTYPDATFTDYSSFIFTRYIWKYTNTISDSANKIYIKALATDGSAFTLATP